MLERKNDKGIDMKNRWQWIALLFVVGLIAGCSTNTTSSSKDENTKATSQQNTLTYGWPLDVGPLNPHAYLPNQMTAQAMVYDSLVSYNDDGTIAPMLAKKWAISEDGKQYTFYLREDVKFSDGSTFNADNVIRNVNAIMKHKDDHSWMGLVRHIKDFKKIDDYTVKLLLDEAYYPVLNELAFVRPFRFLGDEGFPAGDDTAKAIKSPIGTGPWVLKTYKKDEYAIFERNDYYWGEKPPVKEIKINVIPDAESIALAFENNELDMIYGRGVISLDNYEYLKAQGYHTEISEPMSTRALLFNTQSGPLKERSVRQAFQYAINKKQMVDSITNGTEMVADKIFWNNIPYADFDLETISYDVEKAKKLLDEAGWKLPKDSTIREKNGQKLQLELMYIATDAVQKPMAELMQGELAKVGIELTLQGADVMVGLEKLMNDETDINFWRTNGPPTDPHSFMNESSTPNANAVYEAKLGLKDHKILDKKMQQILTTTNEKQRATLYKDVLTELNKEALFFPLSYETNLVITQPTMKNFKPSSSEYDLPYQQMKLK